MARYGSMQYVSPGQWGLVDKIQDENLKRKEAATLRLQPLRSCTQSRDRTGMEVNPLVFETSASTDSAIWAEKTWQR